MGKLPLTVTVSAALHGAVVLIASTQEIEIEIEIDRERAASSTTTIELVDPAAPLSTAPPETTPAIDVALVPDPARDMAKPEAARAAKPDPAPAAKPDPAPAAKPDPAPAAKPDPALSKSSSSSSSSSTTAADPARDTSTEASAADPAHGTSTSISVSTSGPDTTRPDPGRPGAERSRYLEMRRGDRADLSLPGTRDDLDHAPAGSGPEKPPSSGKLAPNGGEHETDEGVYVAKVDKDGRVSLKDRPDVSIRWAVPTPKQIGRGIAAWFESDKGEDGKRGKRTLENEVGGSVDQATVGCEGVRDAACAPDRTPTYVVPTFRGGFNPTDWLMRRTVGDPYASKKRAYLDATRDERAQIRANHRSVQLSETAITMRQNLQRAWASTADMTVRKQLLFELWDEIVDRPADEQSALAEASRTARAQIIGFIRARLPARSTHAYTAAELRAFNANKQSAAKFAPYD